MQILDNLIILLLLTISFFVGKKISDRYNSDIISELEYQLRLLAAQKGIGYIAPPDRKRYIPIGQPFMDKLKETGRATQKFTPSDLERKET